MWKNFFNFFKKFIKNIVNPPIKIEERIREQKQWRYAASHEIITLRINHNTTIQELKEEIAKQASCIVSNITIKKLELHDPKVFWGGKNFTKKKSEPLSTYHPYKDIYQGNCLSIIFTNNNNEKRKGLIENGKRKKYG